MPIPNGSLSIHKATLSPPPAHREKAHTSIRLPVAESDRHPIMAGFQDTCTLPFGGTLETMKPAPGADFMKTVATFIPSFPVYPPEFSWMAVPKTDIPALYAGTRPDGGRTVHLAADLDSCLARGRLPDHATLLAQAFHWLLDGQLPMKVEGAGTLDCRLYRQPDVQGADRIILHLVNLTGCDGQPGSLSHVPPIGPLRVSIQRDLLDGAPLPDMLMAHARVSGEQLTCSQEKEWLSCTLAQVHAHEMIVWQRLH